MLFIEITFFIFLTAIAINICYRTYTWQQAWRWQQIIRSEIKDCCESIGFIGCSIICYNTRSIAEIQRLLSSTYSNYEVIALLNCSQEPELFASIVKHYRMTRVNFPQHSVKELRHTALYRSTSRNFRRLVVMDTSTQDSCKAINEAIAITSYDYIIPLRNSITLLPHAINNIVIMLSDSTSRHIELLYNDTIAECFVFQRDSLILRGGLSHNITELIPRNRILCCNIALACRVFPHKPLSRIVTLLTLLVTLVLCGIVASTISLQVGIACGCTITLAICAARLTLGQWCGKNCSVMAILYQIRKLTQFFHPIKFNIS